MPGKCGCGQLLCSCAIRAEDPLQISGNGTPDTPYLIKLVHGGKTDCAAVAACVGEHVTDLVGYDEAAGTIGLVYKGQKGCGAVTECLSEHLGPHIVYDRTSGRFEATTNCDATMACVVGRLDQLLNTTDPGGNALQVHDGKLLVKPAESGSPWDCDLTVACLAGRLGDGLAVDGSGDTARFRVQAVPGLSPTGGGLTVTDAGVRLDPQFQAQIRSAWGQVQRNQGMPLIQEKERAANPNGVVVSMNLALQLSGAKLDAGALLLEEPGIWTVSANIEFAFRANPVANYHNMIYWDVTNLIGDGSYGGVDALAVGRRYGSSKSGIAIVQPGKPVRVAMAAWRADNSGACDLVGAEIGAAKVGFLPDTGPVRSTGGPVQYGDGHGGIEQPTPMPRGDLDGQPAAPTGADDA
ncbi:hypothetical protein [Streptacidiphilus cavernicola]|uniref:Uncharacterized protein n=1 Tax=Streptacidiphilus cavernicola TaxID=3342716 RepID=A0ABV6VYG1_9ACTN